MSANTMKINELRQRMNVAVSTFYRLFGAGAGHLQRRAVQSGSAAVKQTDSDRYIVSRDPDRETGSRGIFIWALACWARLRISQRKLRADRVLLRNQKEGKRPASSGVSVLNAMTIFQFREEEGNA